MTRREQRRLSRKQARKQARAHKPSNRETAAPKTKKKPRDLDPKPAASPAVEDGRKPRRAPESDRNHFPTITFRLSRELDQAIRAHARKLGVKMSAWISAVCKTSLEGSNVILLCEGKKESAASAGRK